VNTAAHPAPTGGRAAAHAEQPVSYRWPHSLSDVLNAGLRLEFSRGFLLSAGRPLPVMEPEAGGWGDASRRICAANSRRVFAAGVNLPVSRNPTDLCDW